MRTDKLSVTTPCICYYFFKLCILLCLIPGVLWFLLFSLFVYFVSILEKQANGSFFLNQNILNLFCEGILQHIYTGQKCGDYIKSLQLIWQSIHMKCICHLCSRGALLKSVEVSGTASFEWNINWTGDFIIRSLKWTTGLQTKL